MKATVTLFSLLVLSLPVRSWAQAAPGSVPPTRPTGGRSDQLPSLIREAEKGVFFIRTLDSGGKLLATGTGFMVDKQGSILTSLHLLRPPVGMASSAEVIAVDGRKMRVKGVTAGDESLDLAVLQLDEFPEHAVPIELAGDALPERGAYVLVLGHPQGFRFVSTDGIVSAVNRTRELPLPFQESDAVRTGPEVVWLQTSAAISMGNSGGPMLDASGKAIGVIQWMVRGSGMSFALHIAPVRELLSRPPVLMGVEDFGRAEADLNQLVSKFRSDYQQYQQAMMRIQPAASPDSTDAARPAAPEHPALACFPKLLALAHENRGRSVEFRALETLMLAAGGRGCPGGVAAVVGQASARLIEGFRDDRRILSMLRVRPTPAPTLLAVQGFLRALAGESSDPEIRALAALSLALALDPEFTGDSAPGESMKYARLAAASAPEFLLGSEPVAVLAGNLVEKLSHSVAGCQAPPLSGKDQHGEAFTSADLKGRHGVVAFGSKGGDIFDNTSKLLDTIAKQYAGAPLSVTGVGLRDSRFGSDTGSGHKDMLWRNIQDPEDGSIRKAWHVTARPTLFLLDPQGVILGRFAEEPPNTMIIGKVPTGAFAWSSSSQGGFEEGTPGGVLGKALEKIPALAEPRKKLMSLLTSGPWLAVDGWDPSGSGERTVYFREDGKTSVNWIMNWEIRPPSGLHLHLLPRTTGCTDLEVDFTAGEARVTSPESIRGRLMKLRDFEPAGASASGSLSDAARTARDCLLAEDWNWYDRGKQGTEPARMGFRFKANGSTSVTWLPAWEVLPSGQVRLFQHDGKSWTFDFDPAQKSAQANLDLSQIKESKGFTAGGAVRVGSLDAEAPVMPPLRAEVPQSFAWDYTFEPEPGKRLWERINDTTFHESYPSGRKSVFTIKETLTVDQTRGTVAGIKGGGLQVFIPDKGSARMHLKMRPDETRPWSHLGVMLEVK